MLYITGDTHIGIDIRKLSTDNFPEQKEMTKKDYVIICGDFGGVWDGSNEEKSWIKWLNDKKFTTLFIDGNHENFDMLNAYPVTRFKGGKVHKIAPSIYHLMRGQIYSIDETSIFTMGGAASHDRLTRKIGKTWWPDELPTDSEYNEAFKNLEKHNWNVDLVITHCAPDMIQSEIDSWYEHNKLTNFLEVVRQDLKFNKWYFGHYHTDKQIDNFTAIYRVVERYK